MLSGKSAAATKPTALGSLLQAATYGQTIPVIYGLTLSPLLAIWAANLRQGGGSLKKFKQLKKGVTNYEENIDFLLGHNPITGVNQMWNNGTPFPVTYTSTTFSSAGGTQSFTLTDPHFYSIIGVTIMQSYSASFNDYGGFGPTTPSGTYEVPLWNELTTGPDPTAPMSFRSWPFCYRWCPTYGTTFHVDSTAFPTGTITVYYAQLMAATSYEPPIQKLLLAFEPMLGDGPEYTDADLPAQQIIYPMYAGLGSSNINLGAGGVIPQLQAEVQGKWSLYSAGDGDFADMIEDMVKSGLAQAALGDPTTPYSQVEHGLSGYDLPGTIQKKTDSHLTASLPPMLYNLPNVPGNILVVQVAAAGSLTISSSAGDSWAPAITSSPSGYQVWYATAVGGMNTVTVSGASTPWNMAIYEIGGVGTIDEVAETGYGTPGLATGDIEIVVGVDPLMNGSGLGYLQFSKFQLSGSLPSDAVIQGIYPVLHADVSSGGDFFGGYGRSVNYNTYPPVVGTGFVQPMGFGPTGGSPVEFYGATIGTALGSMAGYSINCCVFNTVIGDPAGEITVSGVGMAIYFTTAATVPTPPIPAPFTVPAGQAVIYALPLEGVAYGPKLYAPYFPPHFAPVQYYPNGYVTVTVPSGASSTVGPGTSTYASGSGYSASVPPSPGTAVVSSAGTASVPSTITQGWDAFIMSLPYYATAAPADMEVPEWNLITPPNIYGNTPLQIQSHGRIVRSPGTYTIDEPGPPSQSVMLSLKSLGPSSYPRPVSDFIDLPSLDQVRLQCRAGGLWGSLSMSSQQAASEWLKTLYQAADAAPVFMGFKLYSMPYSEVSAAGNGAVYNALTAGGPTYNLSTENGDFVTSSSSTPPIQVKTAARVNQPNVLQMQCINRASNYNPSVVEQPDAAGISLFGIRKADPIVNNAVQNVAIARLLLGIQVRKLQYGGDVYSFTLAAKWCLLAPMGAGGGGNNDAVITITDPLADINQIPVRITSISEQNNGSLQCTAEPFVYGMYSPVVFAADIPAPNTPNTTGLVASINAPVIFEPVPGLVAVANQGQVWVAVSSNDPNYGGAQVYLSTDGGSSYNPAGDPLVGSATTGISVGDWPAHVSPDTTNSLDVDLTESNGELLSYSTAEQDNFLYPCYIAGGGDPIPYELMTYAVATLTATYKYTLSATGGNHLDRGVYGAPAAGVGVDHPNGSRWCFLPPNGQGILELPLQPAWIGTTIYFKIIAFNTFGVPSWTLSEATAYPYTVLGTSGSGPQLFLVNGS